MPRVQLCENDLFTIANALRVAADQYDKDAKTSRAPYEEASAPVEPGWQRVAEQFDHQAKECRALADRLDDVGDGEDEDENASEAYGRRAADYREDFHSDG